MPTDRELKLMTRYKLTAEEAKFWLDNLESVTVKVVGTQVEVIIGKDITGPSCSLLQSAVLKVIGVKKSDILVDRKTPEYLVTIKKIVPKQLEKDLSKPSPTTDEPAKPKQQQIKPLNKETDRNPFYGWRRRR